MICHQWAALSGESAGSITWNKTCLSLLIAQPGYNKMRMKRIFEQLYGNLWLWAGISVAAMACLKIGLLLADRIPFNSDEAVVALMARHILQGARPVFFYGQAYMGSLDAFLVAAGFAVFGQQVWVIRWIQGLLYLGTMVTTAVLGKQAFGSWKVGVLAMLLLAVPMVNVTLYTTATLGGYGEALLLGNTILILTLKLLRPGSGNSGKPIDLGWWFVLGFLAGLGLWAFGITLVYTLPAGGFLLWNTVLDKHRDETPSIRQDSRRSSVVSKIAGVKGKIYPWLILGLGGLLGSAPWLGYAYQFGLSKLIYELGGGAIAGVEQLPWIFEVAKHLAGFLMLGSTVTLGFRPPWSVDWLGLPLLPFVLILWMAIFAHIAGCLRRPGPYRPAQFLLTAVIGTLLTVFILTPFGADPSGRYFLPLVIPLILFAAASFEHWQPVIGRWVYVLPALLVVYHLWGNLQSAVKFPPGITTQFYSPSQVDMRPLESLIAFLQDNGELYGYTNYWVTYPLAFHSQEDLIFTPRLPYHLDFRHTERDNRYPPYDQIVENAERVAYITTNHPVLDELLRRRFREIGLTWQEQRIGDFQIYYSLSRVVRPEELEIPDYLSEDSEP